MVMRSTVEGAHIPAGLQGFEIAGDGTCYTDGTTSYIDIEGSIVAIGKPGLAPVEVWTNGSLDLDAPALTRVVTYALSAALRRRRLFELHSGALVHPESGRGLLIVGPSGSGKSTLTVHLAAAGWSFLTDDVLLLSQESEAVSAWPLRRCFAITSDTFAASSFLQRHASLEYTRHDKKEFVPHGVFTAEFKDTCIPGTLLFSTLSGDRRSRVSRLSPADSMARLIRLSPWSCYDRSTAAEHLAVLSALVKQSAAYALLAGTDLLDPETSAKLVADHTCES
jgi:energy-coupling factor transporter ATP-binding protein EcfA2